MLTGESSDRKCSIRPVYPFVDDLEVAKRQLPDEAPFPVPHQYALTGARSTLDFNVATGGADSGCCCADPIVFIAVAISTVIPMMSLTGSIAIPTFQSDSTFLDS